MLIIAIDACLYVPCDRCMLLALSHITKQKVPFCVHADPVQVGSHERRPVCIEQLVEM